MKRGAGAELRIRLNRLNILDILNMDWRGDTCGPNGRPGKVGVKMKIYGRGAGFGGEGLGG